MRLLKLNDRVQQMIIDDMISVQDMQERFLQSMMKNSSIILANKIFDEKLSVRETEKLVKALKNPKKEKRKAREYVHIQNLEEQIKNLIGTKVSVTKSKWKRKN